MSPPCQFLASATRKPPPALVFFSGGSAINGLAKSLSVIHCHATYLISGFDSGGSSAALRRSLGMPAVGDLRSRLVALVHDDPQFSAVSRLLAYRFMEPVVSVPTQLSAIAAGDHSLCRGLCRSQQAWIRRYLHRFLAIVPVDFDYRNASLGNLILAGAYDVFEQRLDYVAYIFTQLLGISATVRVMSLDCAHLVAYLDNARSVFGQHRFTGKAATPLQQRIDRISLSATIDHNHPLEVVATQENCQLIQRATLICYPPGSFFSSVIANLLPVGVAAAIVENTCPKVYVPNLGADPEQWQLGLCDQIYALMRHLGLDPEQDKAETVLNGVLVDQYVQIPTVEQQRLKVLGIAIIQTELTASKHATRYDDQRLADALLQLASASNCDYSNAL